VAFVDNAASSTNTNLYLGGWTVTQNESLGSVNDAFILKTKFSDEDRMDWATSLGGTVAYPAGLAATSTGVVLAATYTGSLSTIETIASELSLPVTLPAQGGIALSLSASGDFTPGSNWLRTFEEQTTGFLPTFESPAAMPLAVSTDSQTVYLATTTDDGTSATSTLYAIKSSGTGIGSDRWVKTTAELFGAEAPQATTAQTLSLGNGNLYVGSTADALNAADTASGPPKIGITALNAVDGVLRGTAVVASGAGAQGRSGIITPDGKVLLGHSADQALA